MGFEVSIRPVGTDISSNDLSAERPKDVCVSETPRIGVQLQQQGSELDLVLDTAAALDSMGVDSLWVADHFFPVYGDPDGSSFECYSVLAGIASRTTRATIGPLVSGFPYRNADLTADIARTIDHLSGGRFILGMGSGWFERDFEEYGYEFGTTRDRLAALEVGVTTIRSRMAVLNPAPIGAMPLLIGGSGRRVTLRIVAQHADAWNTFGPPATYRELNGVLDEWCAEVGRDPAEIERTVALSVDEVDSWEDFVDAGATHLIVMLPRPHDVSVVEQLISRVSARS